MVHSTLLATKISPKKNALLKMSFLFPGICDCSLEGNYLTSWMLSDFLPTTIPSMGQVSYIAG